MSKIEIMFLFGIMRENVCSKAGDIFFSKVMFYPLCERLNYLGKDVVVCPLTSMKVRRLKLLH